MSIVRPIIDLNRGWREWYIDEIYTGPNGPGQIVPNVNDKVWSWTRGTLRCVEVDVETGLSKLMEWKEPVENKDTEHFDILIGNGGHDPLSYYQVYFDDSVNPATLHTDAKVRLWRSDADHVVFYYGEDVDGDAKIISMNYDGAGKFLNHKVALQQTADQAVYTPDGTHTTYPLKEGDVVTAVVKNEQGGEISRNKFTVARRTMHFGGIANDRYVTQVRLTSPFLTNNAKVLEVPINLTVPSLTLMGEVVYSNGEVMELPIDGNRFSLYGLGEYVASVPDYNANLILSYKLADNEISTQQSSTSSGQMVAEYKLHTLPARHEYNVKLFVYPRWTGSTWELRYYLASLSRKDIIDVTDHVTFGVGAVSSFNPNLYGITQSLTVSLNMADVDPTFVAYRHVQSFVVTLHAPPSNSSSTPWTVKYEVTSDVDYGVGVAVKQRLSAIGEWTLDIRCGDLTVTDWLNRVYRPTLPLYDSAVEERAPDPTHYELLVNGVRERFPVEHYNNDHVFKSSMIQGESLQVLWVRETDNADLYLGISAFTVKVV